MKAGTGRAHGWLMPTVLILFILEVMLLPVAIGITYGGPSEGPKHVLSYYPGSLIWDSATGILPDGTAELSLFSDGYEGVKAVDGVKIIAPGTQGRTVVRLKNEVSTSINYTAVLYDIKSSDKLNVITTLSGENLYDTDRYVLPDGMESVNIIRTVTGILYGKEFKDFTVEWQWPFSGDDSADTDLGNQAAFSEADDITVGLYIVVEGSGTPPEQHDPDEPDDPDDPPVDLDPDLPTESDNPDTVEDDEDEEDVDPDNDGEQNHPENKDNADSANHDDTSDLIRPEVPKTGGYSLFSTYLVLMGISGAVLLLLLIGGRVKRSDKA